MKDKKIREENLKLQQTVRFFEALLRTSADGIVITDPSKNIVFVNDTFCKIFSRNRQDVIETDLFIWLEKLNPDAREIWNSMESQVKEHDIARDIEFESSIGKEMRYYSVNSSLLEKVDIEETGLIISIWRDNTERKMAQKELQQAHDELEIRVKERTAQITSANIELRSQIEERKITQEALAESEERYRTIVEYSNDMIWTLDTEGNFPFFNKRAEKISGYKLEDWLGKSFAPLIVKEDLPKVIDAFQKTLKGKPQQYEVSFRAKNGQIVTLDGNTAPIYSKGNVVGTVTLGRDITERKRVEEALRDSQSLLVHAFNKSPLMMTISDIATGRYLEVNDSFCEVSGFNRDEAIGKTSVEIGWIDEEEWIRMVHELQHHGKVRSLELTLRSKGGKKVICRYSCDIIQTAHGKKLLSTADDITYRKQVEEELDKSRDMLIKAQEIGQMGSWEWDIATNELVWSKEVYIIYGVDPGICDPNFEIVVDTLASECKDDFLKNIDDALKMRKPFEGDYRIILLDGTIKFTHTKGEVVYGKDRNPIRMYGIVQDITERKLAEEEARLNSEIFKNVSEGIFLLGMDDGLIKHANSKFEEMFGYEPGEMIGKDVSILNAPTDKTPQKTKQEIMDILTKTGEWHGDVKNIRKDGTHFWSYANVSSFDHLKYGRVIVGVHTDITEQKQAEIEREQFFKFFRISNDIMVIADPNGCFKKVNPACLQMLGFSESELLAKPFVDFVHPDDRQSTLDEMARQIKLGFTLRFENRYLCKDGTARWLSWRANYDKEEGLTYATARDITDQKLAEEALRLSEEKYADLYENAPDMYLSVEVATGNIIKCNETVLKTTGYAKDEVIGRHIFEMYHPDCLEAVKNAFREFRAKGELRDVELVVKGKDGSQLDVSLKASAIRDEQGNILYSRSVWRDITKRKRAEEMLKKSEAELKEAQRIGKIGSWIYDFKGKLSWSAETYRIYGVSPDTFIPDAENFMELIYPEDRPKMQAWLEACMAGKKPDELEFRIILPDGSVRNISGRGELEYEVGNRPAYMTGTAQDITQRKHTEAQISESEERFRLAFNNAPIGMALVGLDESIIMANSSLCRILGYTKSELTSKKMPDITHPDDITKEATNKRVLEDGVIESFQIIKRYIHADGHSVIGDLSVSLVKDEQGKPLYYIGQMEDITQRQIAQEEIRLAKERLVLAQEVGKIGTFEWWIKENKTIWTGQMEALYGLPPGGFGERNDDWEKMLHPDDHDQVMDEAARAINEKRELEIEYRIVWQDGSVHWILDKARTIYSESGEPLRMIGVNMDITQRKKAEEALKESEEIFRHFLENSPIYVFFKDENIRAMKLSKNFETMLGKPLKELLGKNMDELFPSELAKSMIADDMRIMSEGKVITVEEELNGRYYFTNKFPIIIDDKPRYLAGFTIDITQRKLADEMLKLHEIRLQDMLELRKMYGATEKEIFDYTLDASLRAVQSDFAFFGLMNEDETVMFNQAWSKKVMSECGISEKPVGYSIAKAGLWGEVVRQRHPIIVNDYQTSKEFKKGYPQGHVPIKRLIAIPIFSGSKIVVMACAANKVSDYNESDVNAFISLIHEMWDILEHRRKEEEIYKNRAMLLKAQEIGHVGSWEWDVASNDVAWTKEIYNIYGLDPDKVKPNYDLVLETMSPESRTQFLKAIDDALTLRKPFDMEYGLIRPDGESSYVHTKGEVLFDSEGRPIKMFGMVQDITQRKAAEAERVQLIQKEQVALAQAQAARRLDRLKSMFIASTSHELRTPLNSIIGFTGLVLDGASGELTPDQKEQLEIVHSSGKYLLALINDIIDLSMMESGRIKLAVSDFNLKHVVDEAARNLNVNLAEKKLDLKVDMDDITMRSDRTRILQCVINLLSNAVKYTEKGSVEITARVIDNDLELSVTDTGIGIKPEDIPKLFGSFIRLQSPLTMKTSGTGLGLYLVKKLARDFLGGDVKVKSEFGKGSTFTLRVPVELKGDV